MCGLTWQFSTPGSPWPELGGSHSQVLSSFTPPSGCPWKGQGWNGAGEKRAPLSRTQEIFSHWELNPKTTGKEVRNISIPGTQAKICYFWGTSRNKSPASGERISSLLNHRILQWCKAGAALVEQSRGNPLPPKTPQIQRVAMGGGRNADKAPPLTLSCTGPA